MCDALNELFADKLECQRNEGKTEGKAEDILMLSGGKLLRFLIPCGRKYWPSRI